MSISEEANCQGNLAASVYEGSKIAFQKLIFSKQLFNECSLLHTRTSFKTWSQ